MNYVLLRCITFFSLPPPLNGDIGPFNCVDFLAYNGLRNFKHVVIEDK